MSYRSANGPPAARGFQDRTARRFFTDALDAASPKPNILTHLPAKSTSDGFTSGGSTADPIFFASSMHSTSFFGLSRTEDISAAKILQRIIRLEIRLFDDRSNPYADSMGFG